VIYNINLDCLAFLSCTRFKEIKFLYQNNVFWSVYFWFGHHFMFVVTF
jgi:hypothetical protein